jgi:hypothetical protein
MRERDRLVPLKQIFGHTEIREPVVGGSVALDDHQQAALLAVYTVENGLVRFEIGAGEAS